MLTPEQQTAYQRDGYLVLPHFKSPGAIQALRQRAGDIVEAFIPPPTKTIFTTNDQVRSVDRYFLDSAVNTSCFFEEEAFGPDGELRQAKALSINKIGHAMHDLDPVFSAFSRGPELQQVAFGLGLALPEIWSAGTRTPRSSKPHPSP
jgi:phytanoyl-CoA hydroxylase